MAETPVQSSDSADFFFHQSIFRTIQLQNVLCSYQTDFLLLPKHFSSHCRTLGFGPARVNCSFVFLFAFRSWFRIANCCHMPRSKPISVRSCVIWLALACVWRGWPHASLGLILGTIWQWGGFFSTLTGFCFILYLSSKPVSLFQIVFHTFSLLVSVVFYPFGSCYGLSDIFSSVCLKEIK